jgi:hypothetical protein
MGYTYDYETESGDEKLSQTQLKWKQKYRRAQKELTRVLAKLSETEAELGRYRAVVIEIAKHTQLMPFLKDLIDPKQ